MSYFVLCTRASLEALYFASWHSLMATLICCVQHNYPDFASLFI
jgi:hypothetical protein